MLLMNRSSKLRNSTKQSFSKKNIGQRKFSIGIPLTDFLPQLEYTEVGGQFSKPSIHTSVISNGLKIITVDGNQPISTVGLFINSGSRFETIETAGASFFLKNMAFKSTKNFSTLRWNRSFELLNATFDVEVGREYMSFCSQVLTDNLSDVTRNLFEAFFPKLVHYEVRDEVENIQRAAEEIERDPRTLIFEILHQQAYRNIGLGKTLSPPLYNIHNINHELLEHFVLRNYTPQGSVIVATGGVNHQNFQKVVNSALPLFNNTERLTSPSEYIGGEAAFPARFDTHLALAFEGADVNSKDFFPLVVLRHLLGNGASFANFGVNQNVSRLNQNVVSKSSFVKEASAFNFNYSDSGLFGIYAIASKGNSQKTVDVLIKELKSITVPVSNEELTRAKMIAKSHYTFEPRISLLEFIGRNAVGKSSKGGLLPTHFTQEIDSVSADRVAEVARKLFKSQPTFVAIGDIDQISTLEKVKNALN